MDDETKPRQPWTPGTWEVFGGRLIRSVDGGSATPLAELRVPYRPGIGLVLGEDESHANGILMAAAPAMAEALAAVVHRYDTRTTDDMCRRPGERKDPPDVAACRAALNLCGWQWGGR